LLAHVHLADGGIVEGVPFAVDWILAIGSVVAEVYLSRVVDDSHQLVDGVFNRMVMVVGNHLRKIEGLGHFYSVVHLLL
jgi:hypothetical protein